MMKRFAEQVARLLGLNRAGGVAVFAVAILLAFLPEIALACDSTGLFTIGGGAKKCDPASTGVFAGVLCFFETALESMLGSMYCVFMTRMQTPVTAAMSIAISIFGLCVIMGYIRMQFREAAKMIAKLALVTAFAFNSDYAIRMVGTLFMGMLQQGTAFVMSPLGGSNILTQPDSMITGLFNFMSNPNLAQIDQTNNCGGQPCLNDAVLRIITNCASFLAVIGIGLMVFLPVAFGFLMMLFIQYIALYVKSILAYLTSIVIICFLLVLSPLFISFALFSPTYRLFERWVQYLRMFSIQGIIMFAFLAMLGVATQGFTGFLYGILRLLRPYDIAMNVMLWTIPISNACSICEYKIEQLATGSQTIKCQPAIADPVTAPAAVTPSDFPPRTAGSGVTGGTNTTATMPNGVSPATPITYDLTMGAVLSNVQNQMPGDASQNLGYNYVIPIMALLSKADFILYVAMNIIAFGIIASLFQEFIGRSGEMARKLGGVSGGGGFGGHADFESGGIALSGMQAVERGIKGMEKEMLRNPFSNVRGDSFINRFRDGLFGRSTVNRSDFKTTEGYLEAKKGEMVTGGAFGAMFYGMAQDQKEKEQELKVAQKRVDEAALKTKEAREAAEADARVLSDALDAEERARKSGTASQKSDAANAVKEAKKKYDLSYQAALERQNTLRKRKQDLRDTEFDMRTAMQGGIVPAGGRVIEGASTGAALLGASATLRRTQKKLDEEAEFQKSGKAKTFTKKTADPNAAAAATARSSKPQTTGRGNSSDELLTAQEEANEKIADLERQMAQYKQFLSTQQQAEYDKALVTAKAALGKAKNERETYEAMRGLASMEASLDKFSDRYVSENAALVGTAALGASLVAASGIVPSAYLQEVKKFLDGAEKETKSGAAGAAKVSEAVGQQTQKLAASTVAGAKGTQAMAASIVPQSALPESTAQIKKAEASLQAAKAPEDYLRVVTQLEGSQETQLREVLARLMGQKEVAQATLTSAESTPVGWSTVAATLGSAATLPEGWDKALYTDKRKYMSAQLDKTQQELASTSGLRSAADNEANKKEIDRIRAEMETASTEEEHKELLRRTVALGQKARSSILPTSPMNMFASFDQMTETARGAAGSARTGNDYNEAMRALLGAPQALNQTVIGGLQQHMDRHRDNQMIPEHIRRKMELQLTQAQMQAQRATTGQQQEDILATLGRQFVGGTEQQATIAMTRWENLPEERKREEAEKLLAKTRAEYEKTASSLTETERKEYEAEFAKASAALSSAGGDIDDLRGVVGHTLAIGGALGLSAQRVQQGKKEEEGRAAAARREAATNFKIGDTTTSQMARDLHIVSHVNATSNNWNKVEGKKRREYEEAVMDSLAAHHKDAKGDMSAADYTTYSTAFERTKLEYSDAREQLAAAKTETERQIAEMKMSGVVKKAAALEAQLHEASEQAEEERRRAAAASGAKPADDDDEKPPESTYSPNKITDYMPTLNPAHLTGNPSYGGYGMYAMQTLTGFDRMSDKRKREYVGAFIEKSKAEIDTFTRLSADEKKRYKAELETISTGLAKESSKEEMRTALGQALGVVGGINAAPTAAPVIPQFVSTGATPTGVAATGAAVIAGAASLFGGVSRADRAAAIAREALEARRPQEKPPAGSVVTSVPAAPPEPPPAPNRPANVPAPAANTAPAAQPTASAPAPSAPAPSAPAPSVQAPAAAAPTPASTTTSGVTITDTGDPYNPLITMGGAPAAPAPQSTQPPATTAAPTPASTTISGVTITDTGDPYNPAITMAGSPASSPSVAAPIASAAAISTGAAVLSGGSVSTASAAVAGAGFTGAAMSGRPQDSTAPQGAERPAVSATAPAPASTTVSGVTITDTGDPYNPSITTSKSAAPAPEPAAASSDGDQPKARGVPTPIHRDPPIAQQVSTVPVPEGQPARVNIFIGGARDSKQDNKPDGTPGGPVRGSEFTTTSPGTNYYATWDARDQVNQIIRQQPPGTIITVVGHSMGGDTAARVTLDNPGRVAALATVDAVTVARKPPEQGDEGPAKPAEIATPDFNRVQQSLAPGGTWTNVNAKPTPDRKDVYDTVAEHGGKWEDRPAGIANTHVNTDRNHAEFDGMLRDGIKPTASLNVVNVATPKPTPAPEGAAPAPAAPAPAAPAPEPAASAPAAPAPAAPAPAAPAPAAPAPAAPAPAAPAPEPAAPAPAAPAPSPTPTPEPTKKPEGKE